jgi:hypothetical protein
MKQSTKTLTLVIGGVLGALLGVKAAHTLIEAAENEANQAPITATQGLQIGITALGMLKQISGISKTRN